MQIIGSRIIIAIHFRGAFANCVDSGLLRSDLTGQGAPNRRRRRDLSRGGSEHPKLPQRPTASASFCAGEALRDLIALSRELPANSLVGGSVGCCDWFPPPGHGRPLPPEPRSLASLQGTAPSHFILCFCCGLWCLVPRCRATALPPVASGAGQDGGSCFFSTIGAWWSSISTLGSKENWERESEIAEQPGTLQLI